MTLYDRLIRGLLLRRRHTGALGSEDSRRAFLRAVILGGATLPLIPGALERITLSSGIRYTPGLIRLMGSGDYITSQAAREAFAAFVSQPILRVIDQAPVLSDLFRGTSFENWTVTAVSAPDTPLDIVWGGTPEGSNQRPHSEIVQPVVNTFHHGRGRLRHPWDIS